MAVSLSQQDPKNTYIYRYLYRSSFTYCKHYRTIHPYGFRRCLTEVKSQTAVWEKLISLFCPWVWKTTIMSHALMRDIHPCVVSLGHLARYLKSEYTCTICMIHFYSLSKYCQTWAVIWQLLWQTQQVRKKRDKTQSSYNHRKLKSTEHNYST